MSRGEAQHLGTGSARYHERGTLDFRDLVGELRCDRGLSVLLIAHDMRVVRRVAVPDRGRIVEHGHTARLFTDPQQTLTRNIPEADRSVSEIVLERRR